MKNQNLKKTITIGIPAHNEEKNIVSLLESIFSQIGNNFVLQHVIVACDGCTDNTAEKVNMLSKKYAVLSLINDGKRLGQAERLNQFYKNLTSDIFIAFDADIVLKDKHVISHIVASFIDDTIHLVGGRVYPLPQSKFIGKILEAQEYFWSEVINSINNGDNVHSHTGPISAGTKQFLKDLSRPKEIVANDHFLYFSALKMGYIYKSAKEACVYIKVPTNFTDYMKQSTRFIQSSDQIKKYFGSWVNQEYAIPYTNKLKAYYKAFRKYPLYLPLALGLVIIQKLFGFLYVEKSKNGIWTQVVSSK